MNYNSYFEKVNNKCLSFIAGFSMLMTIFSLVFNISSIIYNYIRYTDISNLLVYKVIIVTFINFLCCFLSCFTMHSKKQKNSKKSYILCTCLLIICTLPHFSYAKYSIFLILPCVAIILSSFFGDIKLIRFIYIIDLILASLSFIFNNFHSTAQIAIILFTYFITSIIYYVSRQVHFLYENQLKYIEKIFRKQINLEKELKIEPLTKLYNRKAMDEYLELLTKKQYNKIKVPMLAIIDLDFFKKVNDDYGHVNGDKTLITLTKTINKNLNKNMKAYRFGGEEFVITMENTSLDGAVKTIEKIRTDFEKINHEYLNNTSATLSGGIAKLPNDCNVLTWLDYADKALYKAKNNGRNQVIVFEE